MKLLTVEELRRIVGGDDPADVEAKGQPKTYPNLDA